MFIEIFKVGLKSMAGLLITLALITLVMYFAKKISKKWIVFTSITVFFINIILLGYVYNILWGWV